MAEGDGDGAWASLLLSSTLISIILKPGKHLGLLSRCVKMLLHSCCENPGSVGPSVRWKTKDISPRQQARLPATRHSSAISCAECIGEREREAAKGWGVRELWGRGVMHAWKGRGTHLL